MSDTGDYRNRAIAATNALNLAGYKAEHIEHADVVKVYLQDDNDWFVYDLPDIAKYGKTIINKHQNVHTSFIDIRLEYEDNTICHFSLFYHTTHVRGHEYVNLYLARPQFIGYIDGNKYVNYSNTWLKEETSPFCKDDDVLDSNFKPVIPKIVNIKNDKFIMVSSYLIIKDSPIKSFTFFAGRIDRIADGIYTETDDELFKYRNEEGEIFAPLFDPEAEKSYLVSATKIIEMTNADNYRVDSVNGLFNGYKLTSNNIWASEQLEYEDNEDNEYDEDGYNEPPLIYQYKDLFFIIDETFPGELFELSAQKPNSGARTKVALCHD